MCISVSRSDVALCSKDYLLLSSWHVGNVGVCLELKKQPGFSRCLVKQPISHVKIWNHSIETTPFIHGCFRFQVGGSLVFFLKRLG